MHDMSNTRKEIAARLGFAAGNGAKVSFEGSDGNYFVISGYVDNSILGNRTFDTQAEAEHYGKQMLETLKKSNPRAKDVNVQISKVVKYQQQTPFKTLSSRPGAKDAFAAHPSWSEGILGKDTDPKLAAYSWISKNNIETGRKQMLLADLAAGMYEKNPSMSIAQAVLAAAKDMVRKGVATRDIQQWAENGGKFARPGAKASFAWKNYIVELKSRRTGNKINFPNSAIDEKSAKNNAEALYGDAWEVLSVKIANARPGAKGAFAASLSEIREWSQALKKEEQASRKTQKANERANRGEYDIDSATEVRVFSGLNAALQRGDKLLVRKLINEAKREIDATVFRQGVPQELIAWANTTTASRPGAKAAFAMKVDMPELRAEFLGFDVDSNGNKIARFKKYSGETVRIQTNGNLPKSHRMTNQSLDAKAIEQEVLSSSYASKFALKPRSSRPGAKAAMDLTDACWKGYEAVGTKQKDGKTVPNCVPMSRDEREEQKAGLKIMSAANPAVGAKIAKLIKEGKPQDQAIAIALDMQRRGEL